MTPADVREARKALGLTQSDLAIALGLSPANGRVTVSNWETDDGPKQITGPAELALTYLVQGALDDTMGAVLTEHAFAVSEADQEMILRLHRPRFIAAVTDRRASGCDAMEGPTGEWLNIVMWIDDPTAPPGWEADDLLRRALAAWELHTQDAFEE